MILILDDHPLVRKGLESIIRMHCKEEPIVQAGTVREAVRELEQDKFSKVFVDLNLDRESGFALVEWIRKNYITVAVFLVTSSSSVKDFLYAKKLKVDAYILKDAFIDDIVYGIRVVERGGRFYSPNLMEQMDSFTEKERMLYDLTAREKDVLNLLAKGYSNQRISQELYISEGTTKKHISSILGKLRVENRVEASLFISGNEGVMLVDRGGRVI